jgi:HlyD family secretion protein
MLEIEALSHPELQDAIDGQTALFESRRLTLNTQLIQLDKRADQIQEQLNGFRAQEIALQKQLDLIGDILKRNIQLHEKGLIQLVTLQSIQQDEATLIGNLGNITAQKAEAGLRSTETELEQLRLQNEYRERAVNLLSEHHASVANLSEQINALDTQLGRLILRAPIGGIVHDLRIHVPQSVAQPGQTLLHIIPQDRGLHVSARVATSDVDQVHLDQDVTLTFPTFDTADFPELKGKTRNVSADVFRDEQTGQSYFEVEIEVSRDELAKRPIGTRLLPGTPVTAFINTGQRSPLAYFYKPITNFFDKALREG